VAEHELVIGGQWSEGRGGLPDMPSLNDGVRTFAPLEQGVSTEGHYDAHRSSSRLLDELGSCRTRDRCDHEGLDRVHPVLRLVEYH
jgi:hypothetical protein